MVVVVFIGKETDLLFGHRPEEGVNKIEVGKICVLVDPVYPFFFLLLNIPGSSGIF